MSPALADVFLSTGSTWEAHNNVQALGKLNFMELDWSYYHGEGNGNPPQYSCLENPTDRGAWWATVHGVAKSRT